jgi:hypothetical protein
MTTNPISILDLATILFVNIDDQLLRAPHPQQKLELSELVTIGVIFGFKGGSFRRFYTWFTANLKTCFPSLPERSRLQRRLITHKDTVNQFLAQPSFFCIADSYGIELRHPIREFHKPKTTRIGSKGKSNKRWIHGMKILMLINDADAVVDFKLELVSPADKIFNPILEHYDGQTIVLTDQGFRDKNGVPACVKLCGHKTWSERMFVERLFSLLTRFFGAKKRNHRTDAGLEAWWSFLVVGLNVVAGLKEFSLVDFIF